ncbi:MAG: hypothetical protein Q8L29_00810 [archaeon]|nr:hypothetical protein [archaeon]
MKYWLKGGLTFGIVSLFLEILDYILAKIYCLSIENAVCIFPTKIIESPIIFIRNVGNILPNGIIVNIISVIIFYFILGLFIGLIYEKIK